MSSILEKLRKQTKLECPEFVFDNIHYECIVGSQAFGTNNPESSDLDILSVCIPPKEFLFPHLQGTIFGYDKSYRKFDQSEVPHLKVEKKEYDLRIYNIVKFFRMAADCNPMVLESLFVPVNCVLHATKVGQLIRENRKIFLSKKIWHTLKGYAYSQLNNALNKKYENSKRKEDVEKYGFSLKAVYHTVRLLNEAEQILLTGDLDLQLNREQLKSIRRGEWTLEQIQSYFNEKEKQLEELYLTSDKIPHDIQEHKIKELLIQCLEEQYGAIDQLVTKSASNSELQLVRELKQVLSKYE